MTRENNLYAALEQEIAEEVRSILAGAREQGEAVVESARRQLDRDRQAAAARIEEAAQSRLRKALAAREARNRNRLLELKKSETDRLLEALREKLERLGETAPESYATLMEGVFRRCRRLLPEGPLRVVLAPGLPALKERLEKQEGVRVEERDGIRGLLVLSEDGRQRCDGTLDGLAGGLRRRREAELQQLLFRESS